MVSGPQHRFGLRLSFTLAGTGTTAWREANYPLELLQGPPLGPLWDAREKTRSHQRECATTTDRAIIDSSVLMISALAAQLKTTIEAVRQFDLEIEKLCAAHPDFPLFQSLPGAGEVYASRLLAMMGTKRDRWATAAELACLSGIAPVMERSGQSVWIRWRYFCPKFMRQSFHEYAGESVKHSF